MRVFIPPAAFTYPDVIVVSGKPRFIDESLDTLLNPTVIIEVLSESTEARDRCEKFRLYLSIESLAEYVMIDSHRVHTHRFTRLPDGTWNFGAKSLLDDTVSLKSIDCRLLLSDLYERVEFEPSSTL